MEPRPTHAHVLLETQYPLFIAIDASGSMENRDDELETPDNSRPTRREYAIARMHAVLGSTFVTNDGPVLPAFPEVRVLQFGTLVTEIEALPGVGSSGNPAQDALLALDLVHANESQSCVGALINYVRQLAGSRVANLLIILDGEPSDGELYAFTSHALESVEEKTLHVHFLTLGAHADIAASLGQTAAVSSLVETEISLARPRSAFGELEWLQPEQGARPTQPSVPPSPNEEDLEKQAEMAKLKDSMSNVDLAPDLKDPDFNNALETAATDPLPPPAEPEPTVEPAPEPAPEHKPKHSKKHR